MSEVLDKLRDDEHYYGEFGRQYLSNSDIRALLTDPTSFGKGSDDNPVFAKGRYFHQSILEPEKAKDFEFCAISSRNTSAYKEAVKSSGKPFLLLEKEILEIDSWVRTMMRNVELFELIRSDSAKYEVPAVGEIAGLWWKGKADIETDDCLLDLKTTGDIQKFRYSAVSYNYDSQAYIYQQLFGKPLEFIAIDKTTQVMGRFSCSDAFLQRGKEKVESAVEVYNKYFNKATATHNIEDFIITDTL